MAAIMAAIFLGMTEFCAFVYFVTTLSAYPLRTGRRMTVFRFSGGTRRASER